MKLYDISEPKDNKNHESEVVKPIFGIDLGTTNSLIALSNQHKSNIIKIDGAKKIPSVVLYQKEGKPLVGASAVDKDAAIHSVKRAIASHKAYSLDDDHNAIEISAEILRYLKENTEKELGTAVEEVVLTVPAHFDENSRNATKQAAALAGLKVRRMLNEPTAAAIAYGLDMGVSGHVLVFDMGGGTFDVSILKMKMGVFQVIATGGDNHLGGDDYDLMLKDKLSLNNLREARKLKEDLVNQVESDLIDLKEFEILTEPLTLKAISVCKRTLKDAGLKASDVSHVIMVGGATRMPFLQKELYRILPHSKVCNEIDPDLAVVIGASYQAEVLSGTYKPENNANSMNLLVDVVPLSLGIELADGNVEKIIFRNTPLPIEFTKMFTTAAAGQTAIKLHVLQGESDSVEGCRSIARFELDNIPNMDAGKARLEVKFKVDVDGILSVDAHEQISDQKLHIELKPTYGLDTDTAIKLASGD